MAASEEERLWKSADAVAAFDDMMAAAALSPQEVEWKGMRFRIEAKTASKKSAKELLRRGGPATDNDDPE